MMFLSILDIALLIAGLALYLYLVGNQLTVVAGKLEECADLVAEIQANAEPIMAGLDHINHTGGVVAGALPLLYGMAEGIVVGATYDAEAAHQERPPAVPAMGRRRSRMHDGVGYAPVG